MNHLVDYAKRFVGTPYVWGGNSPFQGFDCSGFVQWVLRSTFALPPQDLAAEDLRSFFLKYGKHLEGPVQGALVFYGTNKATHVAIAIDEYRVIEAAGGGKDHVDKLNCYKTGACVRIRPYDYRKDIIEIILPNYRQANKG